MSLYAKKASCWAPLQRKCSSRTDIRMICCVIVIGYLFSCGPAVVHAITSAEAGLPTALWNDAYQVPGGQPSYGLRAAVYPGATMPQFIYLPLLFTAGLATPPSLQFQYRITSTSPYVLPFASLFLAESQSSCSNMLVVRDGTLETVTADTVAANDLSNLAGSLITCDWNNYTLKGSSPTTLPSLTELSVYTPAFFDSVNYFDFLVWTSDVDKTTWRTAVVYNMLVDWALGTGTTSFTRLPWQGVDFQANGYDAAGYWFVPYINRNESLGEQGLLYAIPLIPTSGYNSSRIVTLSGTTAADLSVTSTSMCVVGNMDAAYFMERVPAGTPITGGIMNLSAPPTPRCILHESYSAASMMQQCDNDPTCIGFYTTARVDGAELGNCFLVHRPVNLSQPTPSTDEDIVRLVHWRRHVQLLDASRGCQVNIAGAVDLDILVQSPNVELAVLVNELTEFSCKRSRAEWPYDAFYYCGTIKGLLPGWTVRVIATRVNTLDWACPKSDFQVLFNATPTVLGTLPNIRTPLRSTLLVNAKTTAATALATTEYFRDVVVYKGTETISLEVLRLTSLRVFVQQSAFSNATGDYAIYSPTSQMSCGGSAGFAVANASWSDRCDVWSECPEFSINGETTGLITFYIDWDSILEPFNDTAIAAQNWCKDRNIDAAPTPSITLRFLADVSLDVSFDLPGGWLGTTLPASGDTALSPLILAPTNTTPPGALLPMNTTAVFKYLQDAVLKKMSVDSFVPKASYVMVGDELLACGVDTIGGSSVACVLPLSANTTYVTMRVEDANLADVGVTWMVQSVSDIDGTAQTLRTGSCGGTAGYIDGAAAHGNCGFLRTCISFRTDSALYAGKKLRLLIAVPKGVMSPGIVCAPYAFLAVVSTTTEPQATVTCEGLTCASTGACVSLSRVCDGVSDCGDNSDEDHCFDWYPVEAGAVLTLPVLFDTSVSKIPDDFAMTTTKSCRSLALRNNSNAYAFNAYTYRCIVYNFTTPSDSYSLSSFRSGDVDFTVNAVLRSTLQYSDCSDALSCNSHGTAYTSFSLTCMCSCNAGYTGDTCDRALSLDVDYSRFVVEFTLPLGTSDQVINKTIVVQVLKRWIPKGVFTCFDPVRTSATTLSIVCTDTSSHASTADIGSTNSVADFNRNLVAVKVTEVEATSVAATSAPQVEVASGCYFQTDAYVCTLAVPLHVASLVIAAPTPTQSNPLLLNMQATLTVTSSTRRRLGSTRIVTVTCSFVPFSTNYAGGVSMISCLVDNVGNATKGDLITEIAIFVLDVGGSAFLPTTPTPQLSASVLLRRALSVPALTVIHPTTVQQDFSIWLWCAIALISFGGMLCIVVIALGCIYRAHLKRVLATANSDSSATNLHKIMSILFLQLTRVDVDDPLSDADEKEMNEAATSPRSTTELRGSRQSSPVNVDFVPQSLRPSTAFPNLNRRKYAFCCSSLMLLIWIVAVFLLLYYVSSSGISSNTWLVVERYSDSTCEASSFAATPTAAFYVTDDTATKCERRKVAGSVQSSFYFAGYCLANTSDGSTGATVRFRFGSTMAECEGMGYTDVPAESCMDLGDLWGTNASWYTQLSCATAASTSGRFTFLQSWTSQAQPTLEARVEQTNLYLYTKEAGPSGGVQRMVLRQSGRVNAVSNTDAHFETTGMGGTLFPTLGQQLYLQLDGDYGNSPEMFQSPNGPDYFNRWTSYYETVYQRQLMDLLLDASPLASIAAYLPKFQTPELPIGQIYGYMNRSTQLTGAAAGVTASRYYGARRTIVDVGAYIDTSTMTDGQGFTISFNLRATPQTYGFAFAVTDAMVSQQSGTSPILDLMISILQRNSGADSWFDDDYHIYHSLFVDGPGQQLQFIYAYPARVFGETIYDANTNKSIGKTLGLLSWDLGALNLQRLLNGVWHNVRIVIRLEANLLKVQLIVDGETSRSTLGWNQCLPNSPRPITEYIQGQYLKVFNSTNQVGTEAMLWTGYLNGGVGDLQYMPYVEDIFDIWRASSPAVQTFNRLNTKAYNALGYAMCLLGVVMFVVMLLTSGWDLYLEGQRASRSRLQGVFLRYVDIVSAMRGGYAFLKYTTAKRWLGLSDAQFVQFLDEVQNSTTATPSELHRVLYLAGVALLKNEPRDITRALPTRAEWAALLADDEAKYIADTTRRFPCYREGTPEVDPYQVPSKNGTNDAHDAAAVVEVAHREAPDGRDEGEEIIAAQMGVAAVARVQATFKQEGETGAVNTGNLNFTSGGSATGSQLSMKADTLPDVHIDLRQLFLPIISVVQEVHLWVSSSEMVQQYLDYFQQAFGFISIDFVTSFNLPTLITPIVQLFAGLIAFFVLLYLSSMDEVWFSWYVARYVLKRDALEMRSGAGGGSNDNNKGSGATTAEAAATNPEQQQPSTSVSSYVQRIMKRFPDPFGKVKEFPFEYEVEVLPLKEAMRLDRFLGVSALGKDDTNANAVAEVEEREMTVKDAQGREFTIIKNGMSDQRSGIEKAAVVGVETSVPDVQSCTLDVVGVRCREHKTRRLAPQLQTDIWPFVLAPECCVVTNGVRCGTSQGIVYSCQAEKPTTDGSVCLCDYAVCERHYRGGLVDGVTAEALGVVRTGVRRGPQWILATIAVLGSNAVYMPFVQTALMVLGCHPTYQCEFTECSIHNQKFLLAGFLACCVIAFFGLGLPLMQTIQLRRRRHTLLHVFFADEYNGRYEEKDDVAQDEKSVLEKLQRRELSEGDIGASSFRASTRHGSSIGGRRRQRLAKTDSTRTTKASSAGNDDDGVQLDSTIGTLGASVVLPFSGIGSSDGPLPDIQDNSSPNEEVPAAVLPGSVGPVDGGAAMAELLPDDEGDLLPTDVLAENSVAARPHPSAAASPVPSHHSARDVAAASPDVQRPGSTLAWVDYSSPKKPEEVTAAEQQHPSSGAQSPRDAPEADTIADASSKIVLLSEWSRFLASDPTVLGNLYKPLEFEWIYLSPILLLWKVVIVCPAVFLPSSTFEQLVGICAVEVAFAFFIFVTAPFTSSMADLMYKAGNCHQILFLGVRALDTVARYEGGSGYGLIFLLLTFVYLGFSAACIGWTVVGAQVRKATDRSRSTTALESLGFQYAPSTSLYVVPALDAVRRFERVVAVEGELMNDE